MGKLRRIYKDEENADHTIAVVIKKQNDYDNKDR